MYKRILYVVICCFVLINVCGCNKNSKDNDKLAISSDTSLDEIKEIIQNNSKQIEELIAKNQELEKEISKLNEDKENLNKTITELQEQNKTNSSSLVVLQENDKTINSSIDTKYNELKSLINNNSSTKNNYTISKNQLLGTWKYGSNGKITFTDENLNVYGNWFEWDGMSFSYMYKDGKLYLSDDGVIMTK